MTEQASTEKSIFLSAIEIGSPADRAAYLDEACAGDAELRGRIAALMLAHETPPRVLESQAAIPPKIDPQPSSERPGANIGPYKLLQQIGEGGMGTVYLAEQTHPVQRKVALKVIKPGMDSRQVIARFEAERQALAIMDHVNIARVLDAGTTESGLPYFVMELVHGLPITKYCDDNHLTPRERLELFIPVCQAIQHAHQKGIIHRDIKPSNVMVTLYDGKPSPKVIDFGVAKAMQQRLTERTLFTQYGGMVGTFEYMSPEQAEMSALGVDTRTDIFSLGVLLYELLTGSTPLTHKRLKEAAFAEVLRLIREEEPPKPSTRLSDSGQALASISAQRHMEPAKLTKLVRGELDWIVMKCLEKDRNRRYETAGAFSNEIRRYLDDEPVQACPPSARYRLCKFVRRNRGPVLAASALVLLLLGGIVATTWQALRATRAEKLAKENELDALAQKEKAQANFTLAKEAVDKYLNAVTDNPKLMEADFFDLRKELLETAAPFYQKFVEQENNDPELEAARGRAYRRLGRVRETTGETQAALADYLAMRDVFNKLTVEFPGEPAFRVDLAVGHNNCARLLAALGRRDEAEASYGAALKILAQLAADYPGNPEHRRQLSRIQTSLGHFFKIQNRYADSESVYRTALKIHEQTAPDSPGEPKHRYDLAMIHNNLGILLKAMGRPADAEASHNAVQALLGNLLAEFPREPKYRHDLAMSHNNLANALKDLGQIEKAVERHRSALKLYERLTADFPSVPEYRYDLANSHYNLGTFLKLQGKREDAEAAYRTAMKIHEQLGTEFPAMPEYHSALAKCHYNLGMLLVEMGRQKEAESAYRTAVNIRAQLTADYPAIPDYPIELARIQYSLGRLSRMNGDQQSAVDWYVKTIRILEPLHNNAPRNTHVYWLLRNAHHGRALALDSLERYGEAALDWDRAHALDDGPKKAEFQLQRDQSRILDFLCSTSLGHVLWGWRLF